MSRCCVSLLLLLALVAPTKTTSAIEPTTVAAAFSLARTAVGLIGGNPQSAVLEGNRHLLLALHKKLEQLEDRQRWIQESLLLMPEKFGAALVNHDEKKLIDQLRVHLLTLHDHEARFQRETQSGIPTAWKNHYQRLVNLRQDIRKTLRWLKVNDSPLLMIGRAAAYGILLQVQGQLIAIGREFLSLDEEIVETMGFSEHYESRNKALTVELEERRDLAREATTEMVSLLRGDLLVRLLDHFKKLREWENNNGTLYEWFPNWLTTGFQSPDNQIESGLMRIASLLREHCEHGTYVSDAEYWLTALVYTHARDETNAHLNGVLEKATITERQCGLDANIFRSLRNIPYRLTPIIVSSSTSYLDYQFRTPLYQNVISHEVGDGPILLFFGTHEPDIYVMEQRQYEVAYRSIEIARAEHVENTQIKYHNRAVRLPGLDEISFWYEVDGGIPPAPAVAPGIIGQLDDAMGRGDLWWERGNAFHVPYYNMRVRDLMRVKGAVNRTTLWRWGEIPDVWFVNIPPKPTKLVREIKNLISGIERSMRILERQELIPGDPMRPKIEGVSWRPLRHANNRVNPEIWAAGRNEIMSAIEFLFRVQAEVERSYLAFSSFQSRLAAGEEPELDYSVHPGSVAALLAHYRDPDRMDGIIELLARDIAGAELHTMIAAVIDGTADRIKKEEDKAAIRTALQQALMVAELTYQYAPEIGQLLGEQPGEDYQGLEDEEVSVVEIDIENLEEDYVDHLLGDKKADRGGSDEPGLERSMPLLTFVGGLGLKTGLMKLRYAGRWIGNLWIKRTAGKKTTLLFEDFARRALKTGAGTQVWIETGKKSGSKKISEGVKMVEQALKNNRKVVKFKRRYSYDDVVNVGRRFLCGTKRCLVSLKKSTYDGVVLTRKGSKIESTYKAVSHWGKKA